MAEPAVPLPVVPARSSGLWCTVDSAPANRHCAREGHAMVWPDGRPVSTTEHCALHDKLTAYVAKLESFRTEAREDDLYDPISYVYDEIIRELTEIIGGQYDPRSM